MPDSISGLFGALESDIRWSKLFLVPEKQTKTKIYNVNIRVFFIKGTTEKTVIHLRFCVHTQELLGIGL